MAAYVSTIWALSSLDMPKSSPPTDRWQARIWAKSRGWAQYSLLILEALRALVPVDQIIQRFAECEAEFKTERDTPLRAAKPDTGNLGATGHLPVRYFTCPIFAVSDVGPTVPPNIDGFQFIQKRKMKDYIASLPRP